MAQTFLVAEYWVNRAWEVNQDLLTARQSENNLAHLDVAALDRYLDWIKDKVRQCPPVTRPMPGTHASS